MAAWVQWGLLALGGWSLIAAALGWWFGRMFGALDRSAAVAAVPERATRPRPAPKIRGRRRVLIVDDDPALRLLLRTTLAADAFDVEEVGSAEEARAVVGLWRPGVVLLDVSLPGLDGLAFCAELVADDSNTLVILVTGEDISHTTARLAGAKGVVRKPFSPLELLTLIDRVTGKAERGYTPVPAQRKDDQLLMYARDLGRIANVERAQRQLLEEAYRQTATALADAVEARDRGTRLHAQRVQQYALALAEVVDPTLLQDPSLEYGFLLHDVGKIGIRDHILFKPGPLTNEERREVQSHTSIGAQILGDVALLRGAGLDVVRSHHERWDGAGYPNGLAATEIPLGARVFSVGDTLDAMTSHRPYRDALGWTDAVDEILAQSGRQFDPSVVEAFATLEPNLRVIYEDLSLVA
jgi:response regulator RpfG family c-di-GMP phosphodiesterase